MATTTPFLRDACFDQDDINAMSTALESICAELDLPRGDDPARRIVAERIIDLARSGERNPAILRDRVLLESHLETGSRGAQAGPPGRGHGPAHAAERS